MHTHGWTPAEMAYYDQIAESGADQIAEPAGFVCSVCCGQASADCEATGSIPMLAATTAATTRVRVFDGVATVIL